MANDAVSHPNGTFWQVNLKPALVYYVLFVGILSMGRAHFCYHDKVGCLFGLPRCQTAREPQTYPWIVAFENMGPYNTVYIMLM